MRKWDRGPVREDLLRRELLYPRGPLRKVEAVAELDSTNTALLEAAETEPMLWPERTLLIADHQTAGRGRAARNWQTPPGAAITMSLLVRPRVAVAELPLITLVMGVAACRAIAAQTGLAARLKWPNDVVLDAGPDADSLPGWARLRKVGGILAESLGDGRVVIGIGLNISQADHELPVAHATSLRAQGAKASAREELISQVVGEFFALLKIWESGAADAEDGELAPGEAEILQLASELVTTLGQQVNVTRANDVELVGQAIGLGAGGTLIVQVTDARGSEGEHATRLEQVSVGDVSHLRALTD